MASEHKPHEQIGSDVEDARDRADEDHETREVGAVPTTRLHQELTVHPVERNGSLRDIVQQILDEPQNDEVVSTNANRYLLALAFRNLIENNCKYSENHTSNITIHSFKKLIVTFSDSGIGMSDEEKKNIFKMFYRGNTFDKSGHGIGMAMVQRILSLHKANIEVQTKEHHGTTFVVSF